MQQSLFMWHSMKTVAVADQAGGRKIAESTVLLRTYNPPLLPVREQKKLHPCLEGVFFHSLFFFFAPFFFSVPLVPWSFGPLVLWSRGPLVPWSFGPVVPWSSGSPGPVQPLLIPLQ